ncbi:MAG: protocatechuate 3,4-dioxygenase subunit alpha [Rhizobiaceae bacterium]|nr:protocatechuate 3,4-dioxygenase subunit alpha [Rhizobiaceae bacterium]
MTEENERLKESPSQTAGPYVHIGCTPNFTGIATYETDLGALMKLGPVTGQEITIEGAIFDGDGAPLLDALVEIWQADANGLFNSANEMRGASDPNFSGWGRCPVDMETGEFRFETVKPGRVPWVDGSLQAPHITMWIVARGINIGLQTRIYFADEVEANLSDPILSQIDDRDRLTSLLANEDENGTHRFDVHLQGPRETVFFDI